MIQTNRPARFFTLFFLFSLIFFSVNISTVNSATLYWFSTSSTEWTNSSNWWNDLLHTNQAESAPTNADEVILLGGVSPIFNMNTADIPTLINSRGLTGNANTAGIILTDSSDGGLTTTIKGNATFNDSTNTLGVVLGDAIFNGVSVNSSFVFGDATFNDTSANLLKGTIGGDVVFNNDSYNLGVINGDATYLNPGYQNFNNKGLVKGDANIAFANSGIATITATRWGSVLGTVRGLDGESVSSWVFNGSSINYDDIPSAQVTFNQGSTNMATTSNGIFNESTNKGTISGDCVFNNGVNSYLGVVDGLATFNGTSTNFFGKVSTSIFNDQSINYGNIDVSGTFNDESFLYDTSHSIIAADIIFNEDVSDFTGDINGSKSRRYTSNASTTRTFVGDWTIIADGAHVYLGQATYDSASTTLVTLNGGSFDETRGDPVETPPVGLLPPPTYIGPTPNSVTYDNAIGISNINAAPLENSATISWITTFSATSILNASNRTFGLALVNTTPKTSHSLVLEGLASCSTYQYRVGSANSEKSSISTSLSFTTSGCLGGEDALAATSSPDISALSGGNITFNSGDGRRLVLNIPTNFTSSSTLATFQLARIDTNALIALASSPAGLQTINSNTYQLVALIDVSTVLSTFTSPLSITMTYLQDDIDTIDPSTISIYRFDEGEDWIMLPNCTGDTANRTVTCETDHFSVFSLFGSPFSSSNTHNGSRRSVVASTSQITTPSTIDTEQIKELKKQLLVLMKNLLSMLIEELKIAQLK